MTAKEIISTFEEAAEINYNCKHREGNIIKLTGPGDVIMTGDLHGHERNFSKLLIEADLANNPNRHLVVHELLHSPNGSIPNECHSYRLVKQVAELKLQFPNQIHCLLGNHAMAQATRDEVLKSGQPMVRALNAGLDSYYGQNAQHVNHALESWLLSLPVAAVSDNRIWMSHSLPSMRHLRNFDYNIFESPLNIDIFKNNTSLRALIWDRSHSAECIEELMSVWNIASFVVGHQPQASGSAQPHPNMIILASDHNHGCFLHFKLQEQYQPNDLYSLVKPLASLR